MIWQKVLNALGISSFNQFYQLKQDHDSLCSFVNIFFNKMDSVVNQYSELHREYAKIFIDTDKKLATYHSLFAEHADVINKMVAIHNKNVLQDDFIIPSKIDHEN